MEDWVQAPLILQSADWLAGGFLAWVLAVEGNSEAILTNNKLGLSS